MINQPVSEAEIQKDIITRATYRGWLVKRVNSGSFQHHRFGSGRTAGLPDLICVKRGVCAFIEVKDGKGKLRPDQVQWFEAVVGHAVALDFRGAFVSGNFRAGVCDTWEGALEILEGRIIERGE